MTQERDYLTLDEVEAYTSIKKNSLYYYLKTLDIKTHKFTLDKRAYISLADAKRIKDVKETPWLAGEKPPQKAKKPSVPTSEGPTRAVSEKPQKRGYNRKEKDSGLPADAILAIDFARKHNRGDKFGRTFRDDMLVGLGPGLIHGPGVPEDGSVQIKDYVKSEERAKPSRPREKERYLTSDQQKAAFEFWNRHSVDYSECNDIGCWCHTIKNRER